MRTNYKDICINRVRLMNKSENYPHSNYTIENSGGGRYAVYVGHHTRLSSYLTWPELYEWIEGYQTAYQEMQQAKILASN